MLNTLIKFKAILFKNYNLFILAIKILMKTLKSENFICSKLKEKTLKKYLKRKKFIKVKIFKNYKNKNLNE